MIFILIGAAILLVAPIFHVWLPKKSHEVASYEKELDLEVDSIDKEIAKTKQLYEANEISGDDAYQKIFYELIPKRNDIVDKNDELIDAKIDSQKKFGWKSWRSFANGWGQRLPYVVLLVPFTIFFFNRKPTDHRLFWSLVVFQLAAYTITIYQQVYSFWPGQDLPLPTYRWIILSVGFLMSIAILLFANYYKSTIAVLQAKVDRAYEFYKEMRNVHFKGLLVSTIKINEKYKRFYNDVMGGDLYNEAEEEAIKQKTKSFQKRIKDEAEEIIN